MTTPNRPKSLTLVPNNDAALRHKVEQHLRAEGETPTEARERVIRCWFEDGDPWPFMEAVREGFAFSPEMLELIAHMLKHKQLEFVRGQGRPPKPGKFWEDFFLTQAVEREREQMPSYEQAYGKIEELTGAKEKTIQTRVEKFKSYKKKLARFLGPGKGAN